MAYSHTAGLAYTAGGVITCGSVWTCPVCTAKVRRQRTSEVEQLAEWHTKRGGSLVMVTLTLRHTFSDGLGPLVEGLSEAWRVVQRDRFWRELRRERLTGMVRALEVTHGFSAHGARRSGGWHPHLHVLLLADDDGVCGDVAAELGAHWRSAIAATLGDKYLPDDLHGVDVRPISADAARYVTKISQEVTRGDLKSATRQPWSLVDEGRWARWREYAAAMKGRRAVQFSRGLREAAGIGVLSDAEAAAALLLDLDDGVVVAQYERRYWNRLMREGVALAVLEGIAARCALVRGPAPALPIPLAMTG